jgi:hypothetical protein
VKSIKSKIDCWGAENETINIKKVKKDEYDTQNKNNYDKRGKFEFFQKIQNDYQSINNGFSNGYILIIIN